MGRGLIIAVGWVVAVAAAAVLGVAAVGALAGAGAGQGAPLSQGEVSDRLAQASQSPQGVPTRSAEPGPGPSTTTSAARGFFTTSGGTIWASCAGGQATLDTMAPRQDYRLDGYDKGPAAAAWVRFKLDVRRGHGSEYQVTVTCAAGVPQVTETADN